MGRRPWASRYSLHWGQGLGVGHGGGGGAGGFPGGQAVLHLHVHGAHNVKPVAEDEVIHPGDRPGGGVFHRQHGVIRLAGGHLLKGLFPGGHEIWGDVPEEFQRRLVGKGAGTPLAHHPGALQGQRAGSGGLQLAEGRPAVEQQMLLGPADGHDGAVQRRRGVAVLSPLGPHLSKMACSRWGLNTGMPASPLSWATWAEQPMRRRNRGSSSPSMASISSRSFESRASYSFASTGNRSFLHTFCFVPHTLQQPAFRQQLQHGHTGGGLYGGGGPGHNAWVVAAVDGQRGVSGLSPG